MAAGVFPRRRIRGIKDASSTDVSERVGFPRGKRDGGARMTRGYRYRRGRVQGHRAHVAPLVFLFRSFSFTYDGNVAVVLVDMVGDATISDRFFGEYFILCSGSNANAKCTR